MILNLDLKYCDIFKIPFIPHLSHDTTDLKTVAEHAPDPESLRKTMKKGGPTARRSTGCWRGGWAGGSRTARPCKAAARAQRTNEKKTQRCNLRAKVNPS